MVNAVGTDLTVGEAEMQEREGIPKESSSSWLLSPSDQPYLSFSDDFFSYFAHCSKLMKVERVIDFSKSKVHFYKFNT